MCEIAGVTAFGAGRPATTEPLQHICDTRVHLGSLTAFQVWNDPRGRA